MIRLASPNTCRVVGRLETWEELMFQFKSKDRKGSLLLGEHQPFRSIQAFN